VTGRRPRYRGRTPSGPHRRRRHRQLWPALLVLVVVAGAAAGIVTALQHGKKPAAPPHRPLAAKATTTSTTSPAPAPPPVRSALAPWHQLPVPLTGALVLPGPSGKLVVIGGQVASGRSGAGAFLVDPASGNLRLVANLGTGLHDAAGALLRRRYYVFGGLGGTTAATPTATVMSFSLAPSPAPGKAGASTATLVTAAPTGALPQPRQGAAAVTVGAEAYVVGGSNGPRADPEVVSTSNGATFTRAGTLAVPVRNAAVTAVGGKIYVFGGAAPVRAGAGAAKPPSGAWAPVDDIQRFDPLTHRSVIVGHLPVAVSGAVAANLDGHIYVAGGQGISGLNGSIWGFRVGAGSMSNAGRLALPVAAAGAAVVGRSTWLVGGSRRGLPVAQVQSFGLAAS
jgi:N-acetylneuraminic acid mutarotase